MKLYKKNIIKRSIFILLTMMIVILNSYSCRGSKNLVKNLHPSVQEFLSTVRYIITKEEKKAFLNLKTNKERQVFIEGFWKKRDPDPETEINEFRKQYFERINMANHFFGKKGWLSDRGRVFVILGPPEYRQKYPREYYYAEDKQQYEIWYYEYRAYPITFFDRFRNGNFQLTSLSVQHIEIIKKYQKDHELRMGRIKAPFNFAIKFKKSESGDTPLILQIFIPYTDILFTESEGKNESKFKVLLVCTDKKGNKIPPISKDVRISLSDHELKDIEDNYILNIPLFLDPGKYKCLVTLKTEEEKITVSKTTHFTIVKKNNH